MKQLTFDFADQINRVHAEAMALAAEAKAHIAGAVQKALECGQLMLQQKEALGKGGEGWIDWLATNCPGITEQAARRCMQLAKQAPSLENPGADPVILRQAYLATGLLSESPKAERPPDSARGWVRFVKPLDQFRLWFNTRREQQAMEDWGEDALRILSNELQWFVNLHAEIQRVRSEIKRDEA